MNDMYLEEIEMKGVEIAQPRPQYRNKGVNP